MALLTDARLSVWTAIDNHDELIDLNSSTGRAFNATYRFDDEMALLAEIRPALGDLPALAIFPASIRPVWWTNTQQHWPYFLDVTLWTQDWNLPQAESLIEKVCNAIFRAHPEGSSVSYVKDACGYDPRLGDFAFVAARVGKDSKLKVIETRLSIALLLNKDPFAD